MELPSELTGCGNERDFVCPRSRLEARRSLVGSELQVRELDAT